MQFVVVGTHTHTDTEQGHALPHGDCTAPGVVKTVLITECNWVGLHLFTLGEWES